MWNLVGLLKAVIAVIVIAVITVVCLPIINNNGPHNPPSQGSEDNSSTGNPNSNQPGSSIPDTENPPAYCNVSDVEVRLKSGQIKKYQNIQTAINSVTSNAKITVRGLQFNEYIKIKDKKNIELVSDCYTKIKGALIQESKTIAISGFKIDCKGEKKHCIELDGDQKSNSDVEIRNNEVKGADQKFSGIFIANLNDDIRIKGNKIIENTYNGIAFLPDHDNGHRWDRSCDNDNFSPDRNSSKHSKYSIKQYHRHDDDEDDDRPDMRNLWKKKFGGSHLVENNIISKNGRNGIVLPNKQVINVKKNTISENGVLGDKHQGYGVRHQLFAIHLPRLATLTDNKIIHNNGFSKPKWLHTIDVAFYPSIFDSSDTGNMTTTGLEGKNVAKYVEDTDNNAPIIQTTALGNVLTNNPLFSIPVTIQDASSTTTEVVQNNVIVFSTQAKSFSYSASLAEGNNNFIIRSKDEKNNQHEISVNNVALDSIPAVLSNIVPAADAVLYSQFTGVNISGQSSEALRSITANGISLTLMDSQSFQGVLLFSPGSQRATVNYVAEDMAGNISQLAVSFDITVDNVAPVVSVSALGNVITKESRFPFVVTVNESSPVRVQVFQNGHLVLERESKNFEAITTLVEGRNWFTVRAIDAAENASMDVIVDNVYLDTTAPNLTIAKPTQNSILSSAQIEVVGSSSEELSSVTANGVSLNLDSSKRNFSGVVTSLVEGAVDVVVAVTDIAGNSSSKTVQVFINSRLLNVDLVSVRPNASGLKLIVEGAQFSARPGAEITLRSGWFLNQNAIADNLGRFQFETDFFTSADVTARDLQTNEEQSGSLSFNTNTQLAGSVRSPDDSPLAGVVVTIEGTGQTAVTEASGAFVFDNPVTGDQTLIIDGTTIPESITQGLKKYPLRKMTVNIAIGQNNVLMRPIYLAPLVLDGSETIITAGAATTVTNPAAPGVMLNIPAGSVTFPNGTNSGAISMAVSDAEKTIVPPLEFAVPQKVITLEPSGTRFSQPVQVTVPNENNLPAGVEVAFMSMNSLSGLWELDGIGVVNPGGSSITTKPNAGITHFSEIYAVPISPVVKNISEATNVGADVVSGSVVQEIKLPTYSLLGSDYSPALVYKSAWAKPTAYITNLFDIPKQQINFKTQIVDFQEKRVGAYVEYCFIICRDAYEEHYAFLRSQTDFEFEAWYQPDSISFQFFIGGIGSDTGTISGDQSFSRTLGGETLTYTGLPSQTAVSYAVELKDPSTGEYLPTDVYPSLSRYTINLRALALSSFQNVVTGTDRPTQVTKDSAQANILIEQAFQTDLVDDVIVQNHINSGFGRGWKINSIQKIANPNSNRVVVEEENGNASIYSINNTIDTVLHGDAVNIDLAQGASLTRYPIVSATSKKSETNPTQVLKFDVSSGVPSPSATLAGVVEDYNGILKTENPHCNPGRDGPPPPVNTLVTTHPYRLPAQTAKLFDFGSVVYGVSDRDHNFFAVSPSTFQRVGMSNPPNQLSTLAVLSLCQSLGISCPQISSVSETCRNTVGGPKPTPGTSSGQLPQPSTYFNSPKDVLLANNGYIYVADTGNNTVTRFEPTAFLGAAPFSPLPEKVVGNGSGTDSGDGGLATAAGIYHPRAIAFDGAGNLYIATENGYIRKVDTSGVITKFAGLPIGQGGIIATETHASQLALNRPSSMVVDNDNGLLYVSDTGNHRVIRINLSTRISTVVAGSGGCDQVQIGDLGSSLNASLCSPTTIGLDNDKNLIIVDSGHNRVRRVRFNNSVGGVLTFVPKNKDLSSLARNADGSWTRMFRNGTSVYFDSSGLHRLTRDRVGREMQYSYDSSKNLISIIDPLGKETAFNYSGGKISSITDPVGRTTYFSFSGDNLIRVRYPDNSEKRYDYDSAGLLFKATNERGNPTEYVYSPYNRLAKTIRADGSEINHSDLVSKTMSNGYQGGATGQLKHIGSASGQAYDGIQDTRGIETRFEKDLNGFVTKIIDGNGEITEIIRNTLGLPVQIKRADGSIVSFTFDSATNDLVSVSDSLSGRTQEFEYDQYGNILQEVDSTGNSSVARYDSKGLLLERESNNGIKVNYAYNSYGQVTSITAPISGSEIFSRSIAYDANQNVASDQDSNGRLTTFTHDLAGNFLSVTKKKDESTVSHYAFTYDLLNRLASATNQKNQTTVYGYAPTGEVSEVRNHLGGVLSYEFDALNRPIRKVDFDGSLTEFGYDTNDNLIYLKDPKGQVRQFTYDGLNRLVRKTLPDNVFEYAYDVRGNIISSRDKNSQVDVNLNAIGQVLSTTVRGLNNFSYPQVTLSYSYDTAGKVISMSDTFGGLNNYEYTGRSELAKITNSNGRIFTFGYDGRQRLNVVNLPGIKTDISYVGSEYPTAITHSSSGSTVAFENYTRNKSDIITSVQSNYGVTNYSYDTDNFLMSAEHPSTSHPALQNESFSYDDIGNRTDNGAVYSSNRQFLQEDSRYLYMYDANGNLQAKQNKSTNQVLKYDYSSENQLISVKRYPDFFSSSPMDETNFIYSPAGQRLEKRHVNYDAPRANYTRRYVYEAQKILLELDENNNVLARYTNGFAADDDILGVEITSAGVSNRMAPFAGYYSFLRDHLGTIKHVASEDGVIRQSYAYSAFGSVNRITDNAGNDVTRDPQFNLPFGFTGREYDKETDLYYYRARYYDSYAGRFIQKDPAPGVAAVPKSIVNKYTYVANNPVNLIDPQGLSFLDDFFSGRMFVDNPILFSAVVAVIAIAIIVFSGGTLTGAAASVAATAAGSAVAAAAVASFQEGHFWDNFKYSFAAFFTASALFLAGSAVVGATFGGGIADVGANGYFQGYVQTNTPIFGLKGGLTMGTSSVFSGMKGAAYMPEYGSALAAHEFGHTIQFMVLARLSAATDEPEAVTWLSYIALGLLGAGNPDHFWESMASGQGM